MIGENLKFYRLKNHLSQQDLADMVGLSKMCISNYEGNKREADSSTIIKLADALKIKAALLLQTPMKNVTIIHGKFRRNSKMTKSEEDLIFMDLDHKLDSIHTLLTILGPNALPPVPRTVQLDFFDIETAGKQLRGLLKLPIHGPIGNITDILENAGYIITYVDCKDQSFSGNNGSINGRPYIVINESMAPERQRFTLIHELTHLSFRFSENQDEEKTVDGITGAFLLPQEDLQRELGPRRTDIRGELRCLQEEYGISMQSVLIRSKQCGIISNPTYENHQKWLSMLGLRKDEHSGLPIEKSYLLEKLVLRAIEEQQINEQKASELLDKPYQKIHSLFLEGNH